jgi:hypothetical protein
MYNTKHAIMGMLSDNYILIDGGYGFFKNKKMSDLVLFDYNLIDLYSNIEHISLSYQLEKQPYKQSYKSTMLISKFDENWFDGNLKKISKEIYETKNKWNKKIEIKIEPNSIEEVIELINKWKEVSGGKYGWQLRAGHDVNFFRRYWEVEKENLWSLFFYLGGVLIGYSIVSKEETNNEFNYIIRKMNISVGRNIGLYIDYKTFENIWNKTQKEFKINWGANSGTLLKYKSKFGGDKTQVYFYKVR